MKLFTFSLGSGLTMTNIGIMNMWSRHTRPLPGKSTNNLTLCFLHTNIPHQVNLFITSFFPWTFRKFSMKFFSPIPICTVMNTKKKKTRNSKWEPGKPLLDSRLFFFHYFFPNNIFKDCVAFFILEFHVFVRGMQTEKHQTILLTSILFLGSLHTSSNSIKMAPPWCLWTP